MGLSWSQFYAWKSARVIVTLVLGFCSLVAFAFYEIYFKLDKLIPTHLFKSPGFVPMAICASIGTMVAYSMFILWPQQVEILLPGGPIRHGFQSGLVGCAVAFGFLVGGFVVPYIKNHRMFLLGSCVVLTATVGGMAGVQPYGQALSCTMIALAGFSVGLVETASRSLLPMSCPDEDLGAALGALGCLGFTTASIGTAVYSTILSNKAKSIIPKKVAAAALNGGLPASSLPSLFLSMSLPNITEVPSINSTIIGKVHMATLQGYADSYRYVYYAALAFGVPAIVAACFTISYSKFLTPKVARRMKTTKRQNASAQDEEA